MKTALILALLLISSPILSILIVLGHVLGFVLAIVYTILAWPFKVIGGTVAIMLGGGTRG